MPGVASLIHIDVSGDGSYECLTLAFDDDEPIEVASFLPSEKDPDRLARI
jgi:hypothetical protein